MARGSRARWNGRRALGVRSLSRSAGTTRSAPTGWRAGRTGVVVTALSTCLLVAAPQVLALGRTSSEAPQNASDPYRLAGASTAGGSTPRGAVRLRPGGYRDTIGPGETLWYAATLDAVSTADLSVTAVPRPGARVAYGDGLELELRAPGDSGGDTCDSQSRHFAQDEGATVLTGAVSRTPGPDHGGDACDRAGRYLLSVHRTSAPGSDLARWPIELTYAIEAPLPAGTVPAGAQTDYGAPPAPPTGTPKDLSGGGSFHDAPTLTTGVWRDHVGPARTRYYRVRLGWGQQLTYTAEFAGQPARPDGSTAGADTFVATAAYAPDRLPVEDASGQSGDRLYDGSPVAVGLGTVPVAWTNRWVRDGTARTVHSAGTYWITLSLGPGAARLVSGPHPAVGVILRVRVTGRERSGPQYQAAAPPAGTADTPKGPLDVNDPATRAASPRPGTGVGRITGTDLLAAGTGGALALAAVGAVALVHRSRNRGRTTTGTTGPTSATSGGV